MEGPLPNPRTPAVEIDAMFCDRWSPRAFSPEPLTAGELASLFEAARWAPSCFNEQPWLFLYAVSEADRSRYLTALVEKNQAWARQAPLLLFVLARRRFTHSGKENRHAPFDAGAAWVSLAFQARKLGLYAHGMAGFSKERAYEVLGVAEADYDVMAAVAVGRRASPGGLPEELAAKEGPNDRKPAGEIAVEGRFPA